MSNNNFTSDQVGLSHALIVNTRTFFTELAEYIGRRYNKHDPLIFKLLDAADKLGKFSETDVIELLYHTKEMYNESNRNTDQERNQTVDNRAELYQQQF